MKTFLKNFLISFQKKAFLTFWENGALIFWEMELLIPSSKKKKKKKKTPWKNLLYIWEWKSLALKFSFISGYNFPCPKMIIKNKNKEEIKKATLKKLLIFQQNEIPSPMLKNLAKPEYQNKKGLFV